MEAAFANIELGRYRKIIQTFWDPSPVNDAQADVPVWCLGRQYQLAEADTEDDDEQQQQQRHKDEEKTEDNKTEQTDNIEHDTAPSTAVAENNWPARFIHDFESRFWMTYRSDFPPIPRTKDSPNAKNQPITLRIRQHLSDPTHLTSDAGWGCMIRSGQSLLANATAMVRLGRDWRRGEQASTEKQIISLFADDPAAPYSIHNFVQHGAKACGTQPGEWFGPSATARCIHALVNGQQQGLRVYSTGDGPDVYEDAFMKVAKGNDDGQFHPTLILVGTRLGIDKITPVYWEAVAAALQMPQSVGIAGGRPSSSHYFVGTQGSFMFYLDPHHTRPALPYHADTAAYSADEVDSAHTSRLRRIHIREVDPSMLVGFLIQDQTDWEDWRRAVKHVQGKAIIHVADREPLPHDMWRDDSLLDEVDTMSEEEESDGVAVAVAAAAPEHS